MAAVAEAVEVRLEQKRGLHLAMGSEGPMHSKHYLTGQVGPEIGPLWQSSMPFGLQQRGNRKERYLVVPTIGRYRRVRPTFALCTPALSGAKHSTRARPLWKQRNDRPVPAQLWNGRSA